MLYPSTPVYGLYVFQVGTRSLQGVLNAIAYGVCGWKFSCCLKDDQSESSSQEYSTNSDWEEGDEERSFLEQGSDETDLSSALI